MSGSTIPFEVPEWIPRPTAPYNPVPTTTESVLHTLEVSTATEEAEKFVRAINRLEARLGETHPSAFEERRQELVACQAAAAQRLAQYEHLANIWRGAEFNLGQFLGALEGDRREAVLAAAVEDERRRVHADAVRVLQREIEEARTVLERYLPPAAPAAPATPTSIPELIGRVDNEAQKQALSKLLLRNDANQIYLSAYEANPTTRGRGSDVEGTFTVLGTMRQGTRESYTVKWYRLAARPSFWCNCPDHKFNSARKHMVCKHICFLVTKVGRILDPAFFADFQFTAEQHRTFREAVGSAAMFTAPVLAHVLAPASVAAPVDRRVRFMEPRRPVGAEDACPICYDDMGTTECLNCPTCSNNVHRDCMEVWLERHSTCVFCRSDVWRFWQS